VIGVSRPPVLDCGTTFHPDYGAGLTFDSFRPALKSHLYLATKALSDSVEFIAAIEINLSIYLSRDEWRKFVRGVANPRIEDG